MGKIWFRMSTRFKASPDKGCSQDDINDIIFVHLWYFLGTAFIRSHKRTSVWQRAFWVWQVLQCSLYLVVKAYKSSAQQLNFHVHDTSQSHQRHCWSMYSLVNFCSHLFSSCAKHPLASKQFGVEKIGMLSGYAKKNLLFLALNNLVRLLGLGCCSFHLGFCCFSCYIFKPVLYYACHIKYS